eukprot:TRINITY_DN8904_c0_g1_i1.p1 TRINITY_DN8904_c0_g1~~TRINITY_DN8904_c0_g1_i1.p1  ORF type:complete len:285 (+),score=48.91 TRINITY_DN8904_c0_g1_i1:67-921(+)
MTSAPPVPAPTRHRKIQGCYEKLIVPQMHKLVENWYYFECKQNQRRMFKDVMKGIWKECRDRDKDGKAQVLERHTTMARMYLTGIIRREFTKGVESYLAKATVEQLEAFRNTLGPLHVVAERRATTWYSTSYRDFGTEERVRARPRTYRAEDLKQQHADTWKTFFTKNPKQTVAARKSSAAEKKSLTHTPRKPSTPSPRKYTEYVSGLGSSKHKVEPPPYAHWFDPSDTHCFTRPDIREQYSRNSKAVCTRLMQTIDPSLMHAPLRPPIPRPHSARLIRHKEQI